MTSLAEIQQLKNQIAAERAIERIVPKAQDFGISNEVINFYRQAYGLPLIKGTGIKEPSKDDQARKFALIDRALKVPQWTEETKPYVVYNRKVVWK